jgi:hypothetical protein
VISEQAFGRREKLAKSEDVLEIIRLYVDLMAGIDAPGTGGVLAIKACGSS